MLQGAYITGEETERLINWYGAKREAWRKTRVAEPAGEPAPEDDILKTMRRYEAEHADGGADKDDDRAGDRDLLFREAAEVEIHHQQGSTSLLQRRLKVGYGRAARIIRPVAGCRSARTAGSGPSRGTCSWDSTSYRVFAGMDSGRGDSGGT